MENQEEILDVLTVFEKKPSRDIPPLLEDYLTNVAKTGKTLFPWNRLKPLFINKLEQVMEMLNDDMPYDHLPPFPNVENSKYVDMKKRIIDALQRFNGAPFTVQRICELVTEPRKHYNRCDKFLRGIEKNVMVVSTVDPFGRKIVSDSYRGSLVNGLDLNGFNQQKADASDITDGQPFAALPVSDWTSSSLASVWPLAMGNGADSMKSPFHDESSEGSGVSDINQNNTDTPIDSVTDEVKCDSDIKHADHEVECSEAVDSTVVHKDEIAEGVTDNKDSEITSDSVQSVSSGSEVTSSDTDARLTLDATASFDFQTKDTEATSNTDSNEKPKDSREVGEASDPDSTGNTSTDIENTDLDGPPEKKMKLSDESGVSDTDQETSDTSSHIEPIHTEETKAEVPEEESKSEKSEPTSTAGTEEPVELQVEVEESAELEKVEEVTDQGKQGEDVQQDTETVSEQSDSATKTSEQNIINNVTDTCSETNKTESAGIVNKDSDKDADTISTCKNEDNTEETSCAAKEDSLPPVDHGLTEAMETEQEECLPREESVEVTEAPVSSEDGTEPMEQE